MITIGISGSRGFTHYESFKKAVLFYISSIKEDVQFVSGGAHSGADKLIEKFCIEESDHLIVHLPDYETHGKKAPILRNTFIVDDSDMMIFFWDGKSRGTKDTIEKAKNKGIPIRIVKI